MVGAVAMYNGGNNDDFIRYKFSSSLAYLPAKTGISINWQMRAVVFDSGYWY
jgi:phospholipase C